MDHVIVYFVNVGMGNIGSGGGTRRAGISAGGVAPFKDIHGIRYAVNNRLSKTNCEGRGE